MREISLDTQRVSEERRVCVWSKTKLITYQVETVILFTMRKCEDETEVTKKHHNLSSNLNFPKETSVFI